MAQLITLYCTLLVLSAYIINGWFSITRGRWETNPDGSKYWIGKIFNFWHKFLQQHTLEVRYYMNEEWLKQFAKFKEFFKDDDILEVFESGVLVKSMNPKKAAFLFAFAANKGISLSLKEYDENGAKGTIVSAYKDEKVFKFPYWVRDPLGECINCMASVYGTLLWFFWVLMFKEINKYYPTDAVSSFFELHVVFKIWLGVLFCTVLAHLNEFIFNLNSKLKT